MGREHSRFRACYVKNGAPLTLADSPEFSDVFGATNASCFAAEYFVEGNYDGDDPDTIDEIVDVLDTTTGKVDRYRVNAEAEVRFDAWKVDVSGMAENPKGPQGGTTP